jgi:hypothetical protein
MKTVWKYTIDIKKTGDNPVSFGIPKVSSIVHVGVEPTTPLLNTVVCLWAIVDDASPKQTRQFIVRGTGYPVPSNARVVGSVVIEPFAWHVFELIATNAPVTE